MEDVPHEVAVRLEGNINEVLRRFEREFDVRNATFISERLGEDNTVNVTIQYLVNGLWDVDEGDWETCEGYMWYDREENEWHLSAAPEWATY